MNNEENIKVQDSIKSHLTESKIINSKLNIDIPINTLYNCLVNNPSLVNTIDNNGETILSYAIRKNKEEVFELIMTSPILDCEFYDRSGNSYLSIAVLYEREKMIFPLIEKGIPINMTNNDGNTSLHIAYMINNEKIIKKLIDSKIDVNIKNNQGKIAKDFLENYADDNFKKNKNNNNEINNENNKSVHSEKEKNQLNLSLANVGLSLLLSQRKKKDNRNIKGLITIGDTTATSQKNSIVYGNTEECGSFVRENSIMSDIFDMNSLEIQKKKNNDKVIYNNINYENDKNKYNEDNDKLNYGNKSIEDDDLINIESIDIKKNINKNNIFQSKNENYNKESISIKSSVDINENEQPNLIAIGEFDFNEENNNNNNVGIRKSLTEQIKNNSNNLERNNQEKIKTLFSQTISNDSIKEVYNIEDMIKDKNEKNLNFHIALNSIQNNRISDLKSINEKEKDKVEKKNLKNFLSSIGMEDYYLNFINNGFDDIELIIAQTKNGIGISDKNLKQIGINLPGDRARILLKIQELANNFPFNLPKGVFYNIKDITKINVDEDIYILKLKNWLSGIKLEKYLDNFINGGYYSCDLLLLQMESKHPLNNEILEKDLFIDKLGHVQRIMNKLIEDSKSFKNKLKTSMLIFDKTGNEKNCECKIF